jgi:hypothetical protein
MFAITNNTPRLSANPVVPVPPEETKETGTSIQEFT